jgi:hypothetical protein
MKKVIRLTESDLQRLIKRVIKETEESTQESAVVSSFKLEIEGMKEKIRNEVSDPTLPESDKLQEELEKINIEEVCKSGGNDKSKVDAYVNSLSGINEEERNHVSEILNGLVGKPFIVKLREFTKYKNLLKSKKKLNEVWDTIIILFMILVGILMLFATGLFRRDPCRAWGRMKHNQGRPPRGYR